MTDQQQPFSNPDQLTRILNIAISAQRSLLQAIAAIEGQGFPDSSTPTDRQRVALALLEEAQAQIGLMRSALLTEDGSGATSLGSAA